MPDQPPQPPPPPHRIPPTPRPHPTPAPRPVGDPTKVVQKLQQAFPGDSEMEAFIEALKRLLGQH